MSKIQMRNWGLCAAMAVGFAGVSAAAVESARANKSATLPLQSAKVVATIVPQSGFIDDAIDFDGAGGRLAYVNSDSGVFSEIVVLDAAQQTELFRVKLNKVTLKPSKLAFAGDGEHFLIWEKDEKSAKKNAYLVNSKGKRVKKYGPAKDIVITNYSGSDALVVYDQVESKARKGGTKKLTRHSVEIFDLISGKKLAKKSTIELDSLGRSEKLDFKVQRWAEDYTLAIGLKGGEWDRQENTRSPDTEGWYLMPARSFRERKPIANVVAHRQKMAHLESVKGQDRLMVVKSNRQGLDFLQGEKFTDVKLALPFHHYDPDSLVTQRGSKGSVFFSITVDPVHPDAAAQRKAVKAWTDLYEYTPGQSTAKRRARMLFPKSRKHHWVASPDFWAVVPRHLGFDRGGTKIQLLKLD